MARLLLVCPYCQKKLESSDENIGREGQCPACENLFPITDPERARMLAMSAGEGWLGKAREFEYGEMVALLAVAGVAVGLVLLIASACMPWVKPTRFGAEFLPAHRMAFLAVSSACLAMLALSFLGRKSLVPAVFASGMWGLVALIWLGGIIQTMSSLVGKAEGTPAEARVLAQVGSSSGSFYLALIGTVFLIGAAWFFYYTCRDGKTFSWIGAFVVGSQVLAAAIGLVVLLAFVRPQIESRARQELFRGEIPTRAGGQRGMQR